MVAESLVFLYSLPVFALIDAFAYFVLFKNWKGAKRFEAASCCVSFIHGIAAVVLCSYDLISTYPWKLDAPNTSLENNIMEFSLAYFAIDMLYYIFINPSDYLFILHHIATSSYMISCRYYVGHGGVSTISLICTGEATSPFQNVWTLARMAREESPLAGRIYASLSPVFTVYFTIMRCVVGPYMAWKLCSFYLPGNADMVIPRGLAYFWMVLVILAIVGSSVWVYKLWAGLIKFYGKKRSKSHQSKMHKAE
uniref:TLC domain-containing protein n=1 Tax=Araucaria cunninghamii TaxID=56994 RepID=A0A0D6R482_ARACU